MARRPSSGRRPLHPGPLLLDEPVEQWFGILRRKRLRSPNFADLAALQRAILQFITEWNEIAHPFRWTTRSFDKILDKIDAAIAADAPALADAA